MAEAKSIEVSRPEKIPSARMYYLDNFRTSLTILVNLHHAAIPYGGLGSWAYTSKHHSQGSSLPLVALNVIDQTYFMGSFFLISGYLSSRALKRKGRSAFLKTKLLKLGVPVLAYTLLAGPIQIFMLKLSQGEKIGISIWTDYWSTLRGVKGPVWYCALALVFDVVYAFLPSLREYCPRNTLLNIALDIAASSVIRLWYPMGTGLVFLNTQPAHLPQYIAAYLLGTSLTSPPKPPLSPSTRNVLVATSIASSAAILALVSSRGLSKPTILAFYGGPNALAFCNVLWSETTGYLLGTGILKMFEKTSLLNRSWGDVGRVSYAAFLVHTVVLVGMQIAVDEWKGAALLKTLVVGSVGSFMSWKIGEVLVKTPLKTFLV